MAQGGGRRPKDRNLFHVSVWQETTSLGSLIRRYLWVVRILRTGPEVEGGGSLLSFVSGRTG